MLETATRDSRKRRQLGQSDLVVTRIVAVQKRTFVDFAVVGQQNAAFADGQGLSGHQGKSGHLSKRTDLLALVQSAMGVGAIFQNLDIMLASDRHDGIHVSRHAGVMNDHDRLGPWRDAPLEALRIEADRLGIHISEDGRRPENVGLHDRGPVRDARTDHLIAWADTQTIHRIQNRAGSVGSGQSILAAEHPSVFALKILGDIQTRHLPTAQHVQDHLLVPLGDDGPSEHVTRVACRHLGATQQCQFAIH